MNHSKYISYTLASKGSELLMAIKKYIERARVNALLTTNIYTEIA